MERLVLSVEKFDLFGLLEVVLLEGVAFLTKSVVLSYDLLVWVDFLCFLDDSHALALELYL